MTQLTKEDPGLKLDWRTRLQAHPFPRQILIAGLVNAAICVIVLFQVGLLILAAVIISGTVVGAVLKGGFGRGEGPQSPVSEAHASNIDS